MFEIIGIELSTGRAGAVVQAVITEKNLLGATEVQFSGVGVSAEISSGGTDEELPVRIQIDPKAKADGRYFDVITPGGKTNSGKVTFHVD